MPMSEVSITSPKQVGQPDFRFMRGRLSRWLALGLGSGLSRVAPGTVGTLLAWALFVFAQPWLTLALGLPLVAVAFVAGVWACDRVSADLGSDDHGAIVWDEMVAFWLLLLLVPVSFGSQFAAFVLFRFFDIVKPPPIRQADQRVKGGFGVMLDDVLAALMALLCILAWQFFS